MREIERDAALVVAERLEEERVLALLVGRHVAAHVAATARILDLDHVGPEVGEMHAAPRAGAVLLDRDDPDVLERRPPHARGAEVRDAGVGGRDLGVAPLAVEQARVVRPLLLVADRVLRHERQEAVREGIDDARADATRGRAAR